MFNVKTYDVWSYHNAVYGWRKGDGALSDVFYIGSRKRTLG